MVATNIGDSTNFTVCISDHSTPASGSYALYLTPANITCMITDKSLDPKTEVLVRNLGQFLSDCQFQITWKFGGCLLPIAASTFNNLLKALVLWSKGTSSALYLVVKDSANTTSGGLAQLPAYSNQSLSQMQGKMVVTKMTLDPTHYNLDINFQLST